MTWVDAGALEAIPRRGARVLELESVRIAVFRTGDEHVFALRDRCPHRGGPLSQGIVHGHRVTCPLHDWVIELASGRAVAPDEGCTPVFEVRVEQGRVLVKVPAERERDASSAAGSGVCTTAAGAVGASTAAARADTPNASGAPATVALASKTVAAESTAAPGGATAAVGASTPSNATSTPAVMERA